jgi:hypothetical protein
VINLQRWNGDLDALQQQFRDWPIAGAKEIKAIIRDPQVIALWPG